MIDWTQLDGLRADMGDSFDEVVEVFLQEVDEGMGKLDNAGDSAALAAQLHFLKGAALNLGFSDFAAQCAAGEARAQQGQARGVDIDALRRCYADSRGAFFAGLAQREA